ncbi:MAG: helix-turn-helix domain-containing protein [Candidatus Sericytochromatia bacterium]|nr:helix-turn-helix domain-containing protein [Candidatus Sericytochromatia bacterium]
MRKKIPQITEELSDLKILLKKESKSWIKQRVQMLYLLKSKQVSTILEISSILAVNRNTVGRWLALYEKGNIEFLIEMRKPKGRSLSIPLNVLEKLRDELKSEKSFESYKDIQSWLKKEHDLDIPYKTVHKIVRYRLLGKIKKTKTSSGKNKINKSIKIS